MTADVFLIPDTSREELDDLYRTPLFFKAVAVDGGETVLDALRQADAERQSELQKRRQAAERARAQDASQSSSSGDAAPR